MGKRSRGRRTGRWWVHPSPKAFLTRLGTIRRERGRSVRRQWLHVARVITGNNLIIVTEYFISYQLPILIVNEDLPNDRSTQSREATDRGNYKSSEDCETHV